MSTPAPEQPRSSPPGLDYFVRNELYLTLGSLVLTVREFNGREYARCKTLLQTAILGLENQVAAGDEFEAAVAVAHIATGESVPLDRWRDKPAAVYSVLEAVLIVNADFFDRLDAARTALRVQTATAPNGDGPTSSTSSPPAATPTP